jgi:hypothetical protein
MEVEVPVGAIAIVHVPVRDASVVTESDEPVSRAAGIRKVNACGDEVCIETGSGHYAFRAPLK